MAHDLIDLGKPISDDPLNRGLVFWPFLLPSGFGAVQLIDHAGGNTGTFGATAPTLGACRVPGVPVFTFGNGLAVINCGNRSSVQLTTAVTLSLWVYANSWHGSYDYFCSKEQAGPPYAPYELRNESGNLQWYVATGSGGSASVSVPAAGRWHHVCGTYDGANRILYLNGTAVASAAQTGTLLNSSADLTIGDSDSFTNRALHSGRLEPPMLWDRALSAAEVRRLHVEGLEGYPNLLNRVPASRTFLPSAPTPPTGNRRRRILLGAA